MKSREGGYIWVCYLEESEDVGHHDGLGRETGADHARDGLVRHVARSLPRFALVLGRVLFFTIKNSNEFDPEKSQSILSRKLTIQ